MSLGYDGTSYAETGDRDCWLGSVSLQDVFHVCSCGSPLAVPSIYSPFLSATVIDVLAPHVAAEQYECISTAPDSWSGQLTTSRFFQDPVSRREQRKVRGGPPSPLNPFHWPVFTRGSGPFGDRERRVTPWRWRSSRTMDTASEKSDAEKCQLPGVPS